MLRLILALLVSVAVAAPAFAGKDGLMEPKLALSGRQSGAPRVALTFDACMGAADQRILATLVDNAIPATIFVTARWLKHNAATVAVLRAHPDLFQIENHGAMHVPAVDKPVSIYGIPAAGSPEAVMAEVKGGGDAIMALGLPAPHWFRGATAKYSTSSIAEIRSLGYTVAGFSLNGDEGSLLGARMAAHRIASARDGDVIIAHINQPTHAAGEGVVQGILALKARGFTFLRLDDAAETGSNATVN
ncbi:polysaccharide deacetylase [Rhizobium rhizosphaerae]|uniref:Chitooligosaccharide deacetylase n=1 Tax=Xaviernesmea rhizosphaerae TaxID=1672749 RepID=A0A1Q9AMT0_9HYPH|nr:polysaccharide deacetylase family protein [Xaviernesmea rhizosphaerae]OLP56717.1 polysaccharide deacetylase [Xaviernesmea rhizosphaerae]